LKGRLQDLPPKPFSPPLWSRSSGLAGSVHFFALPPSSFCDRLMAGHKQLPASLQLTPRPLPFPHREEFMKTLSFFVLVIPQARPWSPCKFAFFPIPGRAQWPFYAFVVPLFRTRASLRTPDTQCFLRRSFPPTTHPVESATKVINPVQSPLPLVFHFERLPSKDTPLFLFCFPLLTWGQATPRHRLGLTWLEFLRHFLPV